MPRTFTRETPASRKRAATASIVSAARRYIAARVMITSARTISQRAYAAYDAEAAALADMLDAVRELNNLEGVVT